MTWIWSFPIILQGMAILGDEVFFHRRRELPRWEKIGHPLDSFCFFICLSLPLLAPLEAKTLNLYLILGSISCLIITKDEWVHAKYCSPGEHWLHAILFILHPIVLLVTGVLWASLDAWSDFTVLLNNYGIFRLRAEAAKSALIAQCVGTGIFLIYQIRNGFCSTSRLESL